MRNALLAPRLLLPALLIAPGLQAQTVGAGGDSPDGRMRALEEVVVTANRREQNLQDVPMSVSAFTGEFFENSGVRSLSGLDQYTPSLKITQGTDSNSTSIRIRGIGSVGTNAGIDPSVGMFIDGVYQGRAGMSVADLIDIERVEVLRGPQGTLYGKNTAAGAISIITRKPALEFEAEGEATYTGDERLELRGMVNLPFGDSGHAMRLTGFNIDGDHLYENTYNGEGLNDANKWGLKSRTFFDGDSGDANFGEFLLTVDYSQEDTDCCALAVTDYSGFSPLNAPSTNSPSAELQAMLGLNELGQPILQYTAFEDSEGFAPPDADPFSDDYWIDTDIHNEVEVGGIALEWERELASENTVTFINAWRTYESDSLFDGDFTAYDAVIGSSVIDLDQYSSELRITSPGGETLDYQGGLYAYYSELHSVGTFEQSERLTQNVPVLTAAFPDGTLNTDINDYTTTSYAAFGQVVWNISESLSAMVGLRYTWEKKEREGAQLTDPQTPLDIPPIAGPDIYVDEKRTDDDISPSVNIRYFFTPDVMTYASVSRGFKSGGFNQRRELAGTSAEFDEEIATNYELGWKASSADRSLQVNGTFYFVNYDDFQSQTFDGTALEVTNAGSMQSYGTELEMVYLPASNLTIGSALGYNKAEYKDFDNGQCTLEEAFQRYYVELGNQTGAPGVFDPCIKDLAGEAIDNAPEWTVSSYAQYSRVLTSELAGVARLEYNYIDSFFLDQDLDPHLKNDDVHLVNLRLTLASTERSWEAVLWGNNLLDEEYFSIGLDVPVLGGFTAVTAPDFTYGLTLRLRH